MDVCAVGPIDPSSVHNAEHEKSAPWIVRKLVESMTGRVVLSSYESLRAAGTSVICLSPWGDSSPLLLPCIRFRDLAVHTVIAATGGIAAVAAPVMGPVSDAVVGALGDTVLVELGLHTGFELGAKAADDLLIAGPLSRLAPLHSSLLATTGVKELTITLRYRHGAVSDAALGFFRSSIHKNSDLFAAVKDYLAVEKGWFAPYLFASGRRPVIPRNMKPDVIFCHGPFLSGDYAIGERLLAESAAVITLCDPPAPVDSPNPAPPLAHHSSLSASLPSLSNLFPRSRSPSPAPALTQLPPPPTPRRIVLLVIGLKAHRGSLWTTSARPGESVLRYQLLNGCAAVVLPAKVGAPLLAWDTLTLADLWEIELPQDENGEGEGTRKGGGEKFDGVVTVLCEYLEMCVDWARLVTPGTEDVARNEDKKKTAVRDAVRLLVAAAVRSGEGDEVKQLVDKDRGGIAMWRIP